MCLLFKGDKFLPACHLRADALAIDVHIRNRRLGLDKFRLWRAIGMKKLRFCGLLAALTITPAFAGEVLVNGDFEGGTLGPWYTARTQYCGGDCVDWALTDSNFHSPTHSAVDTGNIELRQDFAGVAGSSVTSVTFWVDGVGVNAVDFFVQRLV